MFFTIMRCARAETHVIRFSEGFVAVIVGELLKEL